MPIIRKPHSILLPYKVNITLLIILILLTPICGLLNPKLLQAPFICIGLMWVIFLLAIVPSVVSAMIKDRKRGKPEELREPFILNEISSIQKQMEIRQKISIQVVPNWPNAQGIWSTLKIGKLLLQRQFGNQQRGIIGHELAHIKEKHSLKTMPILIVIVIVLICPLFFVLICPSFLKFYFLFSPATLSLFVIFLSRLSWRFEYSADLLAKNSLDSNIIINSLYFLADLNHIDINRDSYLHPPILKRIKNLEKLE